MTIWAFNQPAEEYLDYVTTSINKDGVSRFGWGWTDSSNLHLLKNKEWKEMNPDDEQIVWTKSGFLLDINKGDWVVHINTPCWGKCIAAKVVEPYYFDASPVKEDFRHCLKIDPNSVVEFDRNDQSVLPIVSRKLKLRGRFWRVYCEEEFHQSLENLRTGEIDLQGDTHGEYYLKRDLSSALDDITRLIHKNHSGKNLEHFLAKVFTKIPNVEKVIENGSGWGTDHGADLIVEYKSGLPIVGLEQVKRVIVQVKSYEGAHWETNAVEQIKTGIAQYGASAGMLVTTGEKTKAIQEAIDNLSTEINVPIALVAGEDVAKFVIRFYSESLFG